MAVSFRPSCVRSRSTAAFLRRSLLGLTALAALAGNCRAGTLYLSRLSAANENPPTGSTATGVGVLILNNAENQATITATHDITVTVTGGHIHRGTSTVNGPVIFPFPVPASPVGPLTWSIPATDLDNLKNLGLYMNFHTAASPGGAIRGTLVRALLAPAAATPAQLQLANALDVSAGYDPDLDQILIQTNLAASATQTQALGELSARTVYAPVRQEIETMANLANSVLALVDEVRGSSGAPASGFNLFLRGGDEFGKRRASDNQAGATVSRPFAIVGMDYQLGDSTHGGLAVGHAKGEDKFEGGAGSTTTRLTTIQAFFSTRAGSTGVALDAVVGYGSGKVDSTRQLMALGRTATASPRGSVWAVALRASKAWPLANRSTLVPYVVLDGQEAKLDGYSENGAGAAGLVVPGRISWNSALEGGATLLVPVKLGAGTLSARLQAGWHYQFEDGAATIATRLVGSPVAFPTLIDGPGRSAAHVEAAVTATLSTGSLATFGYRGLLGGNGRTIHSLEAQLVMKF